MLNKDNPDPWRGQNDPFDEDFYLVPPEEEIRARAEQVHQDNRDALRQFVEEAIWEAMDKPALHKVLLPMLWLWEAIDAQWLAEASFMTVSDVRDIAESHLRPAMAYPCLDCGKELAVRNRWRHIEMWSMMNEYCGDGAVNGPPTALFCVTCSKQRREHAEQQRRLDRERYEALLKEYRAKPYADRRATREWAILKRRIHRRDGYRCRMCGVGGVELHIHHRTYDTYAEERLEDLITLCRSCHDLFHRLSEAS
jgi:5-methylcytosine-specific restriction endonuclease McrA